MSQRNVERVVGRLITDEAFRRRFLLDPSALLEELAGTGMELTGCELRALACLDARALAHCAEAIDPRLQRLDCAGLHGLEHEGADHGGGAA